MAIVTSISGFSGSGKTRSTKSLMTDYDKDKVLIIRPGKKPISYKNEWDKWNPDEKKGHWIYVNSYEEVIGALKAFSNTYGKKVIIIDDSTFFMTKFFMNTAFERGFDKFTLNAVGYYNMIQTAENLNDDVRVYLINHLEETSSGRTKIKTIGKLLDDKVDIPSLLTVVLRSSKDGDEYVFHTQSNGSDDVKSPDGMFETDKIPNDLNLVDSAICEYWNIKR